MGRGRRCRAAALAAAACAAGVPAGASAAGASAEDGQVIRMVSYNAHWGEPVGARAGRPTDRVDLRRIAADIRTARAEVALVQELGSYRVGGRVVSEARRLARLLGWTSGGVDRHALFRASSPVSSWCRRLDGSPVVKWVSGRPAHCREHGNAILSRRPLVSAGFIDLFRPAATDVYGAVEGRGALRARMRVGRRGLWLATTHLAREPDTATCQLRDLLPQLSGLTPIVLGGDLNMEADTHAPSPRCEGVPPRPLDQLAAVGLERGTPGGPTYPAHRPSEAIDHLFASAGVRVDRVRPLDNCRRGLCSSDHRPLAARVTLPR